MMKIFETLMKVLLIFRLLFCKIGLHKWEEHWHKTQEGTFLCRYCNQHMHEGDFF